MQKPAIFLIALILIFCIYYYFTRRHLEGFIETDAPPTKKVLLDESDLQTFAGPTIREELMRLDPVFLEQQLDIYGQSRKIFATIINTAAGVISSTATPGPADKSAAIDAIAKEAGGERPEFCGKARVDSLLDDPAGVEGLDRLFTCLPATPGRLLLLLSYASRLLKEQLGSAGDSLGGDYASIGDVEEMPSFPIDTRGGSNNSTKNVLEGFDGGVSSSGVSSSGVYISDYALPSVIPREGNNTASDAQTPYKSAIENQLDAWKAAFDSESVKRIQLYIRYCNGVLKKINGVAEDAKSGKLIKKMRFEDRLNATNATIASQLPALKQTGSFQLPL